MIIAINHAKSNTKIILHDFDMESIQITALSDLHGETPELPGGDILIIAGDMTSNDKVPAWMRFFKWLNAQNYVHKICIAGNHDNFCRQWAVSGTFLDEEYDQLYPGEKPNFIYLCDSSVEIEGVKIWGSPWSLSFQGINPYCSTFTGNEKVLQEKFDLIPDDVDILVTHSPPWGILDQVSEYQSGKMRNCGSQSLRKALERTKPKFHIFGHIHENGGDSLVFKRPGYGDENNTTCLNVSILNEQYKFVNNIVTFDLKA